MPAISMKELLEAGVHFGHQTKRWNPKMKEYIFGERNGIYIIDLQKTLKMFKDAARFVGEMAAQGKNVLFVGTKRQAQEAVLEEATRCAMYFVNQRWLGGLLTNMTTVQKSIKRLKELELMAAEGSYTGRSKKEVIGLERERKHLDQNLQGIKNMPGLPDILFVIDSNKEAIAVREARRLGRSVPRDLAVIGFDGLQLGALVEPPLSSVALDTRRLGALAIDQVGRLLTGVDPLGADDLVVRAELRLAGSA